MARKRFQWSEMEDEPAVERKSRSQKKRESSALQQLGEDLAAIPLRELAKLPMKPALLAAYRELPRVTSREARRRHLQYIGRLMREEDDRAPLERALALFREGLSPSAWNESHPESGGEPEEE